MYDILLFNWRNKETETQTETAKKKKKKKKSIHNWKEYYLRINNFRDILS